MPTVGPQACAPDRVDAMSDSSIEAWQVDRVCFMVLPGMHFGSDLTSILVALSFGNSKSNDALGDRCC